MRRRNPFGAAARICSTFLCVVGALAVLVGAGCRSNSIGGEGGDGGTDGGNAATACACMDPLDEASWSVPLCMRSNLECNALTPCPDGYSCFEPYCVCDDVAVCGVACTADCECPMGTRCVDDVGYCRAPLPCFGDGDCAANEICAEDHESPSMLPFCQWSQGNAVGDACDLPEDCASGVCYTNVCLQRCQRNADCPSGQTCEVTHRGTGCVVVSECYNCDEPGSVCDFQCEESCASSGDCDDLCEWDMFDLTSHCENLHWLNCEDHEIVLRGFHSDPYNGSLCYIHQGCYLDEDCPADYECAYDITSSAQAGGAGVCARFVPDRGYVEPPDNPCPCANPGDAVNNVSQCYQVGVTCDMQNPCPTGYACDDGVCMCEDVDVCGLGCDASCGCPVGMACDTVRGVCRDPLPCLDDAMCPWGEVCQRSQSNRVYLMYSYCQVPRPGSPGDPCDSEWDCASALCEQGLCRQRCRSNADCPGTEKCTDMIDGLGCIPLGSCNGTVCDQPDQVCDSTCQTACHTSADCPDECQVETRDLAATCTEVFYLDCGPDEVDVRGFGHFIPTGGNQCYLRQACWLGDDCPLGYSCIWDEIDTTDATAQGYGGLCARFVPDP